MNPKTITISSKEKEWLERTKKTILLHIQDPQFNMDFLGKKVGTSRRQLQRKIKKITGKKPKSYIKDLQLKEAIRLLEKGEVQSVKELALKVGFASPDYFSSIFKKRFGSSPSAFLK